MTVEPHTASVKLMQIQSDKQGHQGKRESAVQIRLAILPRSCLLSPAGAGSGGWEIRNPNPLFLLWAPAPQLLLA